MQEQHDLADDLLLSPASNDPLRPLWTDPGYQAQPRWLLFDDVEHCLTESTHEFLRVDRPNAAEHAGAEIFLDTLDRRRCRCLQE